MLLDKLLWDMIHTALAVFVAALSEEVCPVPDQTI